MSYLRMTIGRWTIDLDSAEAGRVFQQIREEGVSVFRQQPGFIRYRLMRADAHTTIAVAEWESEQLGTAGAQRFRDWLRSSGIAAKLTLETYAGQIVVAS
jgi:heme-degrading monooxygenase HmoA